MNTKTITRRGREWLWPEYDVKLLEAFDDVDNIDTILKYCPNRRVAIQAGGGCGVWPWRLSQEFETVVTFEPDPLNFHCLKQNAPGALCQKYALSHRCEFVSLKRHESEQANAGAGYVCHTGKGDVRSFTIDLATLRGWRVDLIQLDIEGGESFALMGGEKTIAVDKPTIVIEEKPLPQGGDHLCARRLLESWGYVQRAKVGNDVIFTHG